MHPLPILLAALSGALAGAGDGRFDHGHAGWNVLLQEYVVPAGVRYSAWAADRAGLDAYLESLEAVGREGYDRFTREQKLAFWINAYNAFTVQVVLDHYPIRPRLLSLAPANSIRQIPDVWDDFHLETAGDRYSLNRIEHEVLRKEFDEPRVHVALNCASVGCPSLRPEAYTADRIEEQLDDQTRRFARDPRQVRLDRGRRELHVSKIFNWFGADFLGRYEWNGPGRREGTAAAVLAFLYRYLGEEDREFLDANAVRIRFLDYDWTLNEVRNS